MAPHVPELRKKLSYPLYGADFDPLNQDFLLVGGGGGSTSSGVPNKISLIDTSRRTELTEIAEIELAKDEDSVTTLAVASSTETALSAIAGINSSSTDQEAGKNEHLRSFRIALPGRKRKADGSTVDTEKPARLAGVQALGKTALFTSAHGPKNDTYQRVLRASPIQAANEARIAAIASGLAPENEVIAFQPVANALTSTVDEISRINLGKVEAEDIDVKGIPGYGHMLAYCTSDAVFLQRLPNGKGSAINPPSRLYQCPESMDSTPASKRPKFRALRILTPKHLLVLQNRPGRSGAKLLLLVVVGKDDSRGRNSMVKALQKSTKSAVGLDVCALTQSESGQNQYIVAVAGQDSSIEILTIDYDSAEGFTKFKLYTHLRQVHAGPLTKLALSNFIGPTVAASKDAPARSVRLASVGVDQTVVVHNLRLHARPSPKSSKSSKSSQPSYVLTPQNSSVTLHNTFSVLVALLVAGLAALLTQAFSEIRGAVAPTLGATDWLTPSLREKYAIPYIPGRPEPGDIPEALSSAISAILDAPSHISVPVAAGVSQITSSLGAVISANTELETPKAIVLRDTGSDISAELHHDAELIKAETVKKWEDLTDSQKRGWKDKLVDAGHWVEDQGESILKGVLFGELAAFAAG